MMNEAYTDGFSKLEHEGWNRVAGNYESTWSTLTRQYIEPLLDAAQVKPGMKVLDVACGPGYVSQNVFLRNATPIGIDFSTVMIALAKKLYPHLTFQEGDAQHLNFPDDSFDRVIMNFGILHLAKPPQAIFEAYRVLKRGGKLGFTVWAGPENSLTGKVIEKAMSLYTDPNVPMPEAPPAELLADPFRCKSLLNMAGFDLKNFRFDLLEVKWLVPDAHFFFDAELNAGVRTAAFLKRQSPSALKKFEQFLVEGLEQFRTKNGLALPFGAFIVVADKK